MRKALAGIDSADNRKILWWRIDGDILVAPRDSEIWIVCEKTNRIESLF